MKVVINRCFGGFGLSRKAIEKYGELIGKRFYFYKQTQYRHNGGKDEYQLIGENEDSFWATTVDEFLGDTLDKFPEGHYFSYYGIDRTDSNLVKVVEELGNEANGKCAKLEVVEIPDGVSWEIADYDGSEHIAECHRTW